MRRLSEIAVVLVIAAAASNPVDLAKEKLEASVHRPYDPAQAKELTRAFTAEPKLAEAYLAAKEAAEGDADARAAAFEELPKEIRSSPDGLFTEALFGAAADRSDEQVALLEACRLASTDHIFARFHLGRIFRKKDPDRAEAIARELIELHPATGYGMLSDILHAKGDLDGEIEATKAFIEAGGAEDMGIPSRMAEEKLPSMLEKQKEKNTEL